MPQCAGCGKRVCSNEPKITLNKVWHKCCFRCYKCDCQLNTDFARVYKGQIYCHSCFKILRKHCSFEGEDEAATIEENFDKMCYHSSSSNNCYKITPTHSDDCFLCKNKKGVSKAVGCALPRELANYFNRNPIGDKRSVPPVCLKERVQPCIYPMYQCQTKSRPISRRRKCPITSVSRSSSCLDRAAKSLSQRKHLSDSCESVERCRQPYHVKISCGEAKYSCPNTKSHKFIGCAPCRRCGHKVYAAEIVLTSYGAYHNSCFSCYSCLKPLDATNVEEHCGEVFCRREKTSCKVMTTSDHCSEHCRCKISGCYKKHFGFNNYGFRNREA